MKLIKIVLGILLLVLIGVGTYLAVRPEPAVTPAPQVTAPQPETQPIENVKDFNKHLHSLSDPASLWVIANKSKPLPLDYEPPDLVAPKVTLNPAKSAAENQLRADAAKDLEELFKAADAAGLKLMLASGYRSSKLQSTYYNNYVARDGQVAADRYSARPGTSEHQTGWALDIARPDRQCYLVACFGELAEGKWLADNAYKYGFVLRYPDGKEPITGYQHEPWHFRYFGLELAHELHRSGQTAEEFFSISTP